MEPPYARIVTEIRRRIAAGELNPGDRVPSTRQVAQEWGVALATATKALAALSQEGIVTAVPRVGTIVADRERAPRQPHDQDLTRHQIVRAAIDIADAEGMPAVSMRGIAAKLGAGPMSLYRHVQSKEELVRLMIDAAFAEQPLPHEPPTGWRSGLELAARLQWSLCRKHPWLARSMTLSRPMMLPGLLAHGDWMLRALDGHGLTAAEMMHVQITVHSYVLGLAVNLEAEAQAQADTGMTQDEWLRSEEAAMQAVVASGRFPAFARVIEQLGGEGYDFDYDALFEFGLRQLLDGLAGGALQAG